MDDKTPSKRFGEKLRAVREQNSMSQKRLADLVGVTQGYIVQLEKSIRNPNLAMLLKLSRLFGVSIDVLVKDELELDT